MRHAQIATTMNIYGNALMKSTRSAFTTQEPFHIHDWNTDERVPARLKEGIAAQGLTVGPLVFVPLTTPHRRLGALGMSEPPGATYSSDEIAFL
jgi:hypothetical protein